MTLNDTDLGDFVQNACLRLSVALFALHLLFACGSDQERPTLSSVAESSLVTH